MVAALTPTTKFRGTCDGCGKPAVDKVVQFELWFCVNCGSKKSLVEMLEQKYGRERAKEMLA